MASTVTELLRRRFGGKKEVDPYVDWVKLRTRNVSSGYNCYRCASSNIDKMLVDGVEVTPRQLYDFGDTNYHDVYLLFKNLTSLPDQTFNLSNYTRIKVDIPASFVTFGQSTLRGNGASNRVDVIIRATTYPTFEEYNFISWTSGHLWVPDSIYDTYVSNAPISVARIHKLSDWTE